MRTRSIRLRFTLALTAVGIVMFGVYAVWMYRSERGDLRAAATNELRIIGRSLQSSIGAALRDSQRGDVERQIAALEALAPNLDIHIHDAAGTALMHSRNAVLDPELEAIVGRAADSRTEQVIIDPPGDPKRLIFAGPLTAHGEVIGAVAVSRPTDDLAADLARTRTRLWLTAVAFVLAMTITGLVLGTIHVTRPIARLLGGVRTVREGDFRTRVEPGAHDEIGELVAEFNTMIAALAVLRTRIEDEVEARAHLERGLERVDKLVTIGQLSAGLAHEIGSPLQVLAGRAALLGEHADPEVRRQAGLLVAQCDRITRVVEQLLSFGRRKPSLIGACDLVAPVRAVFELLAGEARRTNIALALELGEGPHAIVGDPDQLQQVMLNLLRNALHATPAGGKITVRVERVLGGVRLAVRDTGKGIDTETQARLFEPFFTTRASEGGTGLGLAVVRTIVNEHKAKIDVHSELGRGAEFVITFPLSNETARG